MSFSKQALASSLCAIVVVALMAHTTYAQDAPDINGFVNGHNNVRAEVGVGPVSWDNDVAAYAQNYANGQIDNCQSLTHSGGPYGENLYMGYAGGDWTAESAISWWYSEKAYYDHGSNTCVGGKECRHYTQMVWADSTSIGCARAVCNNGNVFIICNYNPQGNIRGRRPYP